MINYSLTLFSIHLRIFLISYPCKINIISSMHFFKYFIYLSTCKSLYSFFIVIFYPYLFLSTSIQSTYWFILQNICYFCTLMFINYQYVNTFTKQSIYQFCNDNLTSLFVIILFFLSISHSLSLSFYLSTCLSISQPFHVSFFQSIFSYLCIY